MTDLKQGQEVLLRGIYRHKSGLSLKRISFSDEASFIFSDDDLNSCLYTSQDFNKDAEIARLKAEVAKLKREVLHSYSLNSVKPDSTPEPPPVDYDAPITKSNVPRAIRDLHARLAKLEGKP